MRDEFHHFAQYLEYKQQQWMQEQINARIEWERKVESLEKKLRILQEKVDQLKPIHIENIHYKIQELSVKDLSGALNIGMSALTNPEDIEKWMSSKEDKDLSMDNMEEGTVNDES